MDIIWDNAKEEKLRSERDASLDEIAALIKAGAYTISLKNPAHEGQRIFIVPYREYTYVVPYVIDAERNIVLKTAYPSRKYHKLYGDNHV